LWNDYFALVTAIFGGREILFRRAADVANAAGLAAEADDALVDVELTPENLAASMSKRTLPEVSYCNTRASIEGSRRAS